jgi:soluble lytic murein transglycosylase-like protein
MAGVSNTTGAKLLTSLKMLINRTRTGLTARPYRNALFPAGLAVLSLALLPTSASGQIYTWRDANGHLVVSNTSRSGAGPEAKEIVRSYPVPVPKPDPTIRTTSQAASDHVKMYESLITEHARLNDVRPDLVRAVVQVESAYNPYARSPKGAAGLMQLMPATAQLFGVKNAFNPEENVRAGVAYLRQLLNRYENNEELALAAYNAGPKAVDKYGETVPPYPETKNYVFRINGLTARPIERRDTNRIYKVTEIVNGREVVRFTDKRPATGSYTLVGR